MNITAINNTIEYKKTGSQTSFGGPLLSSVFMAVNRHEIIGLSAIDLISMVLPRTAVDFTRNKDAGIETMFREGSSTATNASIGLFGTLAALLLGLGLKKKNYNVDFKAINANSDTIDAMANLFKTVVDENRNASKEVLQRKFLEKVLSDVQGLSGNTQNGDSAVWSKLENVYKPIGNSADEKFVNTTDDIIRIFLEQQNNKSYKLSGDALGQLKAYMNTDIPSLQELKVNIGGQTIKTNGEHFLADIHALTKAFTQENVIKSFINANKGVESEFITDLKKLSGRKTVLGLAAICSLGLSWQAINRQMTKKRTGISGFVGDPNYGKEKTQEKKSSNPFLAMKAITAAAMGFYIFKTINAKNLKDFVSKIQFKGNLPTVDQIKLVYGSVILGRLMAASDKNELRESAFRDFLGFTNFLVLGSLITKWYVNKKDKSLINYDEATHGKGLWNWIKNSSIKTHDDVINSTFKTSIIKEQGVKNVRELYNNNWIKPNGKIAEKLAILNKARLISIGYACVALGIFVPLINKYMTKHNSKSSETQPVQDKFETQKNETTQKTLAIIDKFLQK